MPWRHDREQRDASLDEEIRAHLAMAIADRILRGESPEDAAAAARREFGNISHVKEVTRETWRGVWLERLMQDLAYAARSLRRAPGFAAVAVLTLALGIGVNTAMFTVMNGVLLRPLPFPEPERLFVASYAPPPGPFMNVRGLFDSHFVQVAANHPMFERLTTFNTSSVTLTESGEPASLRAALVTPEFFGVLGVAPSIGRAFAESDAVSDDNVAIVSDALVNARFGDVRPAVGKSITLDGRRRTIVGVMPASFDYPAHTDVWIPLRVRLSRHETRIRVVVGRLKRGVTADQAQVAWTSLAASFESAAEMHPSTFEATLIPLKVAVVGDARRSLLIFAGAVTFVLLIACANVANLLLMRVAARDREIAIRSALGAGRQRLIRQLLTETLAISILGSVVGVVLAVGGVQMVLALAPAGTLPRAENVHIDGWVLLFTAGLSILTAMVCGLVPAVRATEPQLRASLSEGARTVTSRHGRAGSALVVAELALAMVLLTGAGLMLRSFDRMRSIDLGFHSENVVTMTLDLPPGTYGTADQMREYQQRVVATLSRIPGVGSAAAVNWVPLGGALIAGDFSIEGGPPLPPGFMADKMVVSPDYFRAIGVRVESGRAFTDQDRLDATRVVIVSRSIAQRFWPRGDAVGKRIAVVDKPGPTDWLTIAGVVNDVVQAGITSSPDAAIYQPLAQTTQPFFLSHVTFIVHPSSDSPAIASAMRRVVRDADHTLPLQSVVSMADLVGGTMDEPRFRSRLLLTFSVLALALAVIGVYGVLAYGVTQRFHEIGVRVALGAAPNQVAALVVRRALGLTIPGLLIGILSSIGLTRILSTYLFHITPTDPATFAGVAVLLALVALAASYLPARRANRIDPLVALRAD
ncbi:MAG: ADOP family duplicated permease [Deltaproteobacteria bacterium]